MAEVTRREPGQFCWPELATTDQPAAKAFYTSIFGWTTEDMPIGLGATYTMLKLRGLEVGAIYEQGKEEAGRDVPPHWNVYVSVVSADETAARARQLGAKVAAEPFDVTDAGRMAVVPSNPRLKQVRGGIRSRRATRRTVSCTATTPRLKEDPQGAHFAIIRLDVPA